MNNIQNQTNSVENAYEIDIAVSQMQTDIIKYQQEQMQMLRHQTVDLYVNQLQQNVILDKQLAELKKQYEVYEEGMMSGKVLKNNAEKQESAQAQDGNQNPKSTEKNTFNSGMQNLQSDFLFELALQFDQYKKQIEAIGLKLHRQNIDNEFSAKQKQNDN